MLFKLISGCTLGNCDRMIGYDDAACAVGTTVFGRSSFRPVLDNVQCTGEERELDMCSFTVIGSSKIGCRDRYSYYYDAGVVCINSKLSAFSCIFHY